MKSSLAAVLIVSLLPAAGCVADAALDLGPNHPASAEAEAAPVQPAVTALDPRAGEVQIDPAPAGGREHAHAHGEAHADHQATAPRKQPPAPYPLDVCLVSDEKLGGHGKPYVFEHEGREIKLCCKMCLKDFQKEPAAYLKKLDDAAKKKQPPAGPAHSSHDHKH